MEQALQYSTDATVSDALLRHLIDPILDQRLTMAYAKLKELMAVHKEHPETRNHYFTDNYNALQRQHSEARAIRVLEEEVERRGGINVDDVPDLVKIMRQKTEADMDLVAVESTFNAVEAFYKVYQRTRFYSLLAYYLQVAMKLLRSIFL